MERPITTDATLPTTTATMMYAKTALMRNQRTTGHPETDFSLEYNFLINYFILIYI
jgi:hypothetical protein